MIWSSGCCAWYARATRQHSGSGWTGRQPSAAALWPVSRSGEAVQISAAQLGYLLEGIDWRNPRWTQRPVKAGLSGLISLIFMGIPWPAW